MDYSMYFLSSEFMIRYRDWSFEGSDGYTGSSASFIQGPMALSLESTYRYCSSTSSCQDCAAQANSTWQLTPSQFNKLVDVLFIPPIRSLSSILSSVGSISLGIFFFFFFGTSVDLVINLQHAALTSMF